MVLLKKVNSDNKDFITLVKDLDAYLKIKDGDEHSFYNQFNKIDSLKYVIVAYKNLIPIGCGAIKKFNKTSMEVKRMFVLPEFREMGIASQILTSLETWTKELGFNKCILETGERQVEAVRFYKKSGYKITQNYGQYKGVENSICFEKLI